MKASDTLEQSYLTFLEFLLSSKQQLFALAAEHQMSGMQLITLLLIEEPRPMHSFKHLLNCDASNVTGIIDGLQQRKLVTRYECRDDRRIKMVKLLAKGEQLRASLLHQLAVSNALFARLTSDERQTFMAFIRRIA